jgi:hypothetical protein
MPVHPSFLTAGLLIGLLIGPVAGAQSARGESAEWPAPGTRLQRVEELPATSPASALPVGGAGATDLSRGACAMRLRDPRTGSEFLIQHSEVRQRVARDSTGAMTARVETSLTHAVGEYTRIERGADTTHSRLLSVDCLSSQVVAAGSNGS